MMFSCRLLDLLDGRIAILDGLPGAWIEASRHGETDLTHAGQAVGLTDFRASNVGIDNESREVRQFAV